MLKRCVSYKFVLMLYFQVNRLKYFYAVAEFDSAESANKVGYKLEISLEIILQMFFFNLLRYTRSAMARSTSCRPPAST